MNRGRVDVPLSIQVASGIGGILLVIGIVLLATSRLDQGTWGSLGDAPARVTILGLLVLLGAALSNAVRGNGDRQR